ncbi:MAG: class I SAM-dependent methyltransferase [Chloroflexi bacterium]|nr:class I SAM-dependent methyltransferase [Chloroflexota bacterium]
MERKLLARVVKYLSPGIQIATVLVALLLGLVQILTPVDTVVVGILFLILENVVLLVVERETLLPSIKELSERHILMQHQLVAMSNWILSDEYKNAFDDFAGRIADLGSGRFVLELSDVPQISLQIVRALKREAFATVVVGVSDKFFGSELGQQYLRECYDAAKRISGSFVRLFIFERLSDVTPLLLKLMEEHRRQGIEVLVATHAELTAENLNPEDDFGLWDGYCLMRVEVVPGTLLARMAVHVEGPEAEQARRKSIRLSQVAKPLAKFLEGLCQPVNGIQWTTLLPQVQSLAPPVGPSMADIKKMWEMVTASGVKPQRVLVLGYTKAIVDYFLQEGCSKVDVLDIGLYHPHHVCSQSPRNISFIRGNWLTWSNPYAEEYDVVLGDDAINNLAVYQYYIFFRNISSLLKPDGLLIMRAIGRYGSDREDLPGFQTTLSDLKKILRANGSIKEDYLVARLIPTLHSPDFYDEPTRTFDIKLWNKWLRQAEAQGLCTYEETASFSLNYPLLMTSLPFSELLQYAKEFFNFVEQSKVDQAYVDLYPKLDDFYRILSFRPKVEVSTGQKIRSAVLGSADTNHL